MLNLFMEPIFTEEGGRKKIWPHCKCMFNLLGLIHRGYFRRSWNAGVGQICWLVRSICWLMNLFCIYFNIDKLISSCNKSLIYQVSFWHWKFEISMRCAWVEMLISNMATQVCTLRICHQESKSNKINSMVH